MNNKYVVEADTVRCICENFEKAIQYRELIQSLNVISEKQKMEGLNQDLDAFAYYCDDEYISIQVFHLRNGKMIERNGYLYQKTSELDQFHEFIIQFYLLQNNPLPKNIYISDGDIELLSETLNHKIQIPKIGQNLQLIKLVESGEIKFPERSNPDPVDKESLEKSIKFDEEIKNNVACGQALEAFKKEVSNI